MMLWKCCTQYTSKFGKLSSGHKTGKVQFSFQSQRKAMPNNYCAVALISHVSKIMLKILQARLQLYMNQKLPDVQAGFRKDQTNQRSNCQYLLDYGKSKGILNKVCFIDYAKAFDCVDHNILLKILKETGIPDHFTCLLRNLHVGQEATVRTGHGKIDWFKIGKGVCQGCILSPCFFNFFTKYIIKFWAVWSTILNQDFRKKQQ